MDYYIMNKVSFNPHLTRCPVQPASPVTTTTTERWSEAAQARSGQWLSLTLVDSLRRFNPEGDQTRSEWVYIFFQCWCWSCQLDWNCKIYSDLGEMVQPAFVMLQSSNIEIFLQHKQTERETSPSISTTLSRFVHTAHVKIRLILKYSETVVNH